MPGQGQLGGGSGFEQAEGVILSEATDREDTTDVHVRANYSHPTMAHQALEEGPHESDTTTVDVLDRVEIEKQAVACLLEETLKDSTQLWATLVPDLAS